MATIRLPVFPREEIQPGARSDPRWVARAGWETVQQIFRVCGPAPQLARIFVDATPVPNGGASWHLTVEYEEGFAPARAWALAAIREFPRRWDLAARRALHMEEGPC